MSKTDDNYSDPAPSTFIRNRAACCAVACAVWWVMAVVAVLIAHRNPKIASGLLIAGIVPGALAMQWRLAFELWTGRYDGKEDKKR